MFQRNTCCEKVRRHDPPEPVAWGTSEMAGSVRLYGYDPVRWDPRRWVDDALAQGSDGAEGVVVLIGMPTLAPGLASGLWEAVVSPPSNVIVLIDLGQWPPEIWRHGLQVMSWLARRVVLWAAVPVPMWPAYAAALEIRLQGLKPGCWTEATITGDVSSEWRNG